MTISHMASKWRCFRRTCRDRPSGGITLVRIREGSFFDRTTLTEAKIFALSYFWLQDIGSVATKEYELGISHGSVAYWEQRFRDVCCKFFRRNRPVLDGFGITVEVDETLVTKRRHNCGPWTRQHQWLFGGYERGSGNSFLFLVRRRDARTLLKLITKYIRPGTTIISDLWRAYNGMSSLPQGYLHLTVNHRMNFDDPNSGAHTKHRVPHWQKFKALAKRKYGINSRRLS
ncbi:unnamed protein product [Nippostrongylus brasiliensis]|uniref:DDE_Tnp_IS1595 domain-containing protein n=1 Tax=Nippostrongylus brasiliensis TaxID=27835 RepID=A0A0N4XZJ9_NIPBR|nr:unnamed protein product [Nippostrongylus brasiliensis]